MLDYQLFLGFPVNKKIQTQLDKISENVRSLLIQNHPDYLQLIEYQRMPYLGKHLGPVVDIANLELIEAHIYSLLRRLSIDCPSEEVSLVLIAT